MEHRHRLLLVEDHTLLRHGIKAMVASDPDIEVVGETDNGRDAVHLAGTLSPGLIIMDLSMPGTNGMEAISQIKRRYPEIRILVLTVHKAEEYIRESLRAGADGYVLKHATRDELMLAIRSLFKGKTYLSPDVANSVVTGYLDGWGTPGEQTPFETMTHREREVLKLIAEGHSNKHIASYLCVSVKTVEKHRSNLMKKLNLHNAAALTAFAIEKGMVIL
jgi:two-component system response regulator NreC